jgi:LacI family transcriptional regulator
MAKPTRDQVAKRAGVSTAVVSYVLNNGPRGVSAEARARVLEAVEALDYRPNAVARALRARRTHTIGLIVPDNGNPFYAELARAIEDESFSRGHALLLGNSGDDPAREESYIQTFLDRQVDALLLISVSTAPDLSALEGRATRAVVLDRSLPGGTVASLVVDDEGGALEGVRHLVEHGHRRIGLITGPGDVAAAQERRRGWSRALQEADLPASDGLVVRAAFTRSGGYAAAHELLARRPRVSAVFVSADVQAIGLLRAVTEAGLSVPDDVAVVSFDGIEDSAYSVPTLTTLQQPLDRIAERAVERLLDNVDGEDGPLHEVLPVRLVVRRSCGCADVAVEPRPGSSAA